MSRPSIRIAALTAALALLSVPAAAALPLVERPAAGSGDTLAVFYSGDGGWAAIDQGVADGLVRAGIPVVGINSLAYFGMRRAPDQAAADLARVLESYLARWGKRRVIVAGYSFGADALPEILLHLPPALRGKVRLVALVGADRDGELKFQPGDWLGRKAADAYPIAPVLAQLKGLPMVCVYGEAEADSACPAFASPSVRVVRVRGGHHYDGDYDSIARAIVQAAGP